MSDTNPELSDLYFMPNYSNEDHVKQFIARHKIEVVRDVHDSGYRGHDVPNKITLKIGLYELRNLLDGTSSEFCDSVWGERVK